MNFKRAIKNEELIVKFYDKIWEFYFQYLVTDERIIQKKYKEKHGEEVNLKSPVSYNEKLQWLKLNWDDPKSTMCTDKFEVRKYVEERIGSKYLNELIGVYESTDEININDLPKKFVLKGTHGSGFNIICADKNEMDWDEAFKKMRRWLRRNYFWTTREPNYKSIKPRIICEKFIEQENNNELRDYRFFCFDGDPKLITVDLNINDKSKTNRNLYDLDWNLLDAEISYPKNSTIKLKKPEKFDEMLNLSKKLSTGFPHARVDFYYTNGRIIFGEITFFHQSGRAKFFPKQFGDVMGSWLNLPN